MPKKIRVEADICAPKPIPPKGHSASSPHGQKVSLERGTATRSKKNPGKRLKRAVDIALSALSAARTAS